ncbi:acyltransferase family protein [uncultured Pseudokineococcus sp.]|uniref:acyltransferase family protein n=1 Tax=uncultured Pseudokineococcus sp. TaxID=1642928 RepID=UPI002604321F|nr:acyltransferase family protein [uncultured Pseudokineococcus sp.]
MTQRVSWLDSARGAAIFMIVFHHVLVLLEPLHLVHWGYGLVEDLLAAFPMPLFFLVSGVLARGVLNESWGRLWRHRLGPLLWLYVVWTVVRFLWFSVLPLASRPEETDVVRLLLSPLYPTSGLWYLHALALALVLAKVATKRLRVPWQLLVAAGVSVAFFGPLDTGSIGYQGLAHYLVFFLVGVNSGPALVRAVEKSPPVSALAATTVFTVLVVTVRAYDLVDVPGIVLALSVLAVTTGLLCLRHLPRLARGSGLEVLGRASLIIYVTHFVVLAGLTKALLLLLGPAPAGEALLLVQLFALPVMVVLAIGASLGLGTIAKGTPLQSVYQLPRRRIPA